MFSNGHSVQHVWKKNKNNEDVINSFSDQFVLDNLIDNWCK